MLERDGEEWWFRRNPEIRMSAGRAMLRSRLGSNVLNPAIALLSKSNRLDDKDHHDFSVALDILESADRNWLKQSLERLDRDHVWLTWF